MLQKLIKVTNVILVILDGIFGTKFRLEIFESL